eukprot:TRINITY_DN4309_c0_g1_i2.p2 TRINITY_DN4309_c0_g1~~TRINITY_DN4309_c0_g1_i2.p2  ORF type:complete len:156 (-),score=17.48 TRINITY_DN4309_c0_g1_i2:904-1371(-)
MYHTTILLLLIICILSMTVNTMNISITHNDNTNTTHTFSSPSITGLSINAHLISTSLIPYFNHEDPICSQSDLDSFITQLPSTVSISQIAYFQNFYSCVNGNVNEEEWEMMFDVLRESGFGAVVLVEDFPVSREVGGYVGESGVERFFGWWVVMV